MSEEWGPWIKHDGKGCPCVGQYVRAKYKNSQPPWATGFVAQGGSSWNFDLRADHIIIYSIRKPRGLTILDGLLENLPDEVPA